MPRPSKAVSPDTLGGRIRAARKHLHLSLAEVADGHYSISLLSQIERNRIDPSQESLRFLAERLQLPLEELERLAHRHCIATETFASTSYENLWLEVIRLFQDEETEQILVRLHDLHFPAVPFAYRWRLATLRGQCHFAHRHFLKAEQDFIYALREQPALNELSAQERTELMLLHLHLGGTYRELQQLEEAQVHYQKALHMIDRDSPSGYVAEAHWGMALITLAQANKLAHNQHATNSCRESMLLRALEHAENTRILYRAIDDQLLTATVICQMARIEQALGQKEKARTYLEEVFATWSPVLHKPLATSAEEKRMQQKEASVVSSAACTLANIELEDGNYCLARSWVEQALLAGQRSYKRRRADAYMVLSRILAAIDPEDAAIEEALRHTIEELADTDRLALRIGAHLHLGHHLLKIGKMTEGEHELEQAYRLSDIHAAGDGSTAEDISLS